MSSSAVGTGREVSVSLDGKRDKNLMQLKKLNTVLFPVGYNDKYYADTISSGEFTKLAYYSDIYVGAIACRLEKKEDGGHASLYNDTWCSCTVPCQSFLQRNSMSITCFFFKTNNEDAIKFYKKFG
ncbi:hypothetical protein N665_2396s0002 [Sinapis alba]|nr:hypothetical protein N665_2396s0002 [Sinapis alba]